AADRRGRGAPREGGRGQFSRRRGDGDGDTEAHWNIPGTRRYRHRRTERRSEAKPVGLTYVAIADDDGVVSEEHIWQADRSTNKQLSAQAALRLALNRARGPS